MYIFEKIVSANGLLATAFHRLDLVGSVSTFTGLQSTCHGGCPWVAGSSLQSGKFTLLACRTIPALYGFVGRMGGLGEASGIGSGSWVTLFFCTNFRVSAGVSLWASFFIAATSAE